MKNPGLLTIKFQGNHQAIMSCSDHTWMRVKIATGSNKTIRFTWVVPAMHAQLKCRLDLIFLSISGTAAGANHICFLRIKVASVANL